MTRVIPGFTVSDIASEIEQSFVTILNEVVSFFCISDQVNLRILQKSSKITRINALRLIGIHDMMRDTMNSNYFILKLKSLFSSTPLLFSPEKRTWTLELPKTPPLFWKGKPLHFKYFLNLFKGIQGVKVTPKKIVISPSIKKRHFARLVDAFSQMIKLIEKENLQLQQVWSTARHISPSGFSDENGDLASSQEFLQSIYQLDYMVSDKKPLVLDLKNSYSSYLVSIPPNPKSIIDAASQIATLGLGINAKEKKPLLLRPEILQSDLPLKDWDIYHGFKKLLQRESGLPHSVFVNSGSEAIETGFRTCQLHYPERRKVISFDGSFHGRTLLSLHSTFSPSKRVPFEVYKDLVTFLPFPETKTPSSDPEDPEGWKDAWSDPFGDGYTKYVQRYVDSDDPLLKSECEALIALKVCSEEQKPLAVIVEPMQCEGGDRYGTSRFFRGLRLLTRALDVPLIFDEVQTGFGLGGHFFWHKKFSLIDREGNPDHPDIVCLAKKAQVGVCLSQLDPQKIPLREETSPASIYRGYLQACAALENPTKSLEAKIDLLLKSLQDTVGSQILRNPRNSGICFAFDLPSPEIAKAFVETRFKNGLLFYPAGEVTARFRVLYQTTDRELAQIFIGIYRCLLDLAGKKLISSIPSLGNWAQGVPSSALDVSLSEMITEKPQIRPLSPIPENWTNLKKEKFLKVKSEEWNKIFNLLVRNYPQALRSKWNQKIPLEKFSKMTPQQLWKKYQSDLDFTQFDLLWFASRALGHRISRLRSPQIKKISRQIVELEKSVYEPVRQDDPELFIKEAKHPKCIFLICEGKKKGELIGLCSAAPLAHFKHLPLVKADPKAKDPNALYSMDLSIHPQYQRQGIGLRLKAEQYMAALYQKSSVIRSRNRYPEAESMSHLNRFFSAVVVDKNHEAYGGGGTALYQSITLEMKSKKSKVNSFIPVQSPLYSAIQNKMTLSNFVSPTYVTSSLAIQSTLPKDLKHIYLSSGRAESVDKIIKIIRSQYDQAHLPISFKGDFFGSTTAAARSLGGPDGIQYFRWPRISAKGSVQNTLKHLRKELSQHSHNEVLGIFVDLAGKSLSLLKEICKVGKKAGVPIIFQEKGTQFSKASQTLKPDAVLLYAGGQLGIIAVNDRLYNSQKLTMISTWDGDELDLSRLESNITGTSIYS